MVQALEGCKVNATKGNGMTTPHSHPAETNTQNTNDLDFPTGHRSRKAESTVIARLALAGHVVHRGTCCDYIVCKYGLSYYAQDVESLQAFARKLGVCNV